MPLRLVAARRDGGLCLGAALALADREVSTYAGTALWDQRKRPRRRPSRSLGPARRPRASRAGRGAYHMTRPLKSGKSLAHVEMDVMRGDEPRDLGPPQQIYVAEQPHPGARAVFRQTQEIRPFLQPLWVRHGSLHQARAGAMIDAPATRTCSRRSERECEPAAAGVDVGLNACRQIQEPPTLYRSGARGDRRDLLGGIHGGSRVHAARAGGRRLVLPAPSAPTSFRARAMTVTLLSSIACDGKREALLEGRSSPADRHRRTLLATGATPAGVRARGSRRRCGGPIRGDNTYLAPAPSRAAPSLRSSRRRRPPHTHAARPRSSP